MLNFDEIRKWHRLFRRPNELFEIRILGDKTYSGYFYDVEQAITALQPYDNFNIYYSVNEVKQACASREQFGNFRLVRGTATSKADIEHRWWIPIDVDCERPSGVSSTKEEKDKAYIKAKEVFLFLQSLGFPTPAVIDSSSGYHLYVPCDLNNDDEAELLVKKFLEILALRFNDESVKIDTVLFDANRIIRLPGSYGRKGLNTAERPHRPVWIMSEPNRNNVVGVPQLQWFKDMFEVKVDTSQRRSRYNQSGKEFDIDEFLRDYNISVAKVVNMPGGGRKFVLTECPFDSSHKAPDSAVFEMADGSYGFKCFHNSCSQYTWRDFRLHFDPSAYDHEYNPQQPIQGQRQAPVPKKVSLLEENPTLGNKWLSMKNIKKVNINELEGFKTGFKRLDRKIKKLFYGELTILSGTNSSGKTSWLNELALNIIQQDLSVALYSGEMNATVLKSNLQTIAAGKSVLMKASRGDYWFVPDTAAQKIDDWMENKFFLHNNNYTSKWEQILNDMKELRDKCGVRVFILDNLFSLDINIFDGDNNAKQRAFVTELTSFCKYSDCPTHIILVAHPRKSIFFLRKSDISGSANISDAADNVFIIHRLNKDFKRAGSDFLGVDKIKEWCDTGYGNLIEIAKNRMMGVQDYFCGMYFDIPSRRFLNTPTEDVKYNWRTDINARDMSLFDEATYSDVDDDGDISSQTVKTPFKKKEQLQQEDTSTTNAPSSRRKDKEDNLHGLPYMKEYMEDELPF